MAVQKTDDPFHQDGGIKGQYPTQMPDYDYNTPPPPNPRSNRGRIRYTQRQPFPTRAVIKIAQPPQPAYEK